MTYRKKKTLALIASWLITVCFLYSCFKFSFTNWFPALLFFVASAIAWTIYFKRFLFTRTLNIGYNALRRYRRLFNVVNSSSGPSSSLAESIVRPALWPIDVLVYVCSYFATLGYKPDPCYWLIATPNNVSIESITQSILSQLDGSSAPVPENLKLPSLGDAIQRAKEIMSKDANVQEIGIVDFGDYVVDGYGVSQNVQWTVTSKGNVTRVAKMT